MVKFLPKRWFGALALVGLSAPGVLADDTDRAGIERLEALIQAQQNQIQDLQQQVSLASQDSTDAARVQAMREQIRSILNEKEFRDSLMPSSVQAGYDNGFYIGSTDENFLLKFNGLIQFRWTHYGTRSDNKYTLLRLERNDRTGFDVNRIRFSLGGHAYTKDLTYHIELQQDAANAYDAVLTTAWVNYRFADEFQVKAGAQRLLGTRQQGIAHDGLQLVDRGLSDAVFGFGYGIGVQFWGTAFENRLDYGLQIVNGLADGENASYGRTITPDPAEHDNNPAIIFRTVWHALGDNPGTHFQYEGDNDFTQNPALDIGFHYAFNDDMGDTQTTRIPFPWDNRAPALGGFGLTNTNGAQINQFGFDTGFKWNGFSLSGEYIVRIVDPRAAGGDMPWTNWWLLTGDESTTAQHGAYVQAGYFLPIPGMEKKLEAVVRIGGISTLAEQREGTWEYAGGLNYYIEGNKVKLQTDVTKITELPISNNYSSYANVNDDALIWRVQLSVAF